VKGLKTVQQIAAENEVPPTQVTQWKSQMIEGASEVFEPGRGRPKTRRNWSGCCRSGFRITIDPSPTKRWAN
jgi:hypothetical protein